MERPCSLCEAPSRRALESFGSPFYHCAQCDLIFVPREWHLSLAAQVDRYRRHQNTPEHAGYAARFEALVGLIQERCQQVSRILDYGCGPGPVLVQLLQRAGYEAVGYDPHFFSEADISRPFDAVVSTETFEHFADPRGEMKRILGLIRPGGYLAVMTEFHSGVERFGGWCYARDRTHVAFYSLRTLDYLCETFEMKMMFGDTKRLAIVQRRSMGSPGEGP